MTTSTALPPAVQAALDATVAALKKTLGENLQSLVLYGSAVRGNLQAGVSDLNLLILLEVSTPDAHAAIAEVIRGPVRIEPFILGCDLLARSMQAFAVQFLSIRRNYRVIHGVDPFAGLVLDESLAKFLCEQAVRNLRLRCVRAFVVLGHDRPRYSGFLARLSSALFTGLAEGLRRVAIDVPRSYEERIPLFEQTFKADASVLRDVLALKTGSRVLSAAETKEVHTRLFKLLDAAVRWMEAQWPPLR